MRKRVALSVYSTMRQAHRTVRMDVMGWNQIRAKVGRCDLETGGECEVHAPVTTHVPGGHPASSPSCPASPPEHAQSFTRFGAPRMHCFSSSSRLHSPRYYKQEGVKEGYFPPPTPRPQPTAVVSWLHSPVSLPIHPFILSFPSYGATRD